MNPQSGSHTVADCTRPALRSLGLLQGIIFNKLFDILISIGGDCTSTYLICYVMNMFPKIETIPLVMSIDIRITPLNDLLIWFNKISNKNNFVWTICYEWAHELATIL